MTDVVTQRSGRSDIAMEALCRHHDILTFSCESAEMFELSLSEYWKRSAHAYGDRVLAAVEGARVVGYVVSVDTDLSFEEDPDSDGLFFYVSTLAVDDSRLGSSVAPALVQRTFRGIEEIESLHKKRYRGILVSPFLNPELEEAIASMGFTPIPATGFWFKLR